MQVSHGCVRLYPEDIERLFPLVPIKTPGEFVYDTLKIGQRDGVLFAESHADIYGYKPAAFRDAQAKLESLGVMDRVDREALVAGLSDSRGLPFRISPGDDGPQLVSFDRVPHGN
jgi:L,D-transpeptidase ErfK/SrfK